MSDPIGSPRRRGQLDTKSQYQLDLWGVCSSTAMFALSITVVIYTFVSQGHRPLGILFLVLAILSGGTLLRYSVKTRRYRSQWQ
jgi:hypothetical protein